MFLGACLFNLPVCDWDALNVKMFNFMFRGADSFNQCLDKWNAKIAIMGSVSDDDVDSCYLSIHGFSIKNLKCK